MLESKLKKLTHSIHEEIKKSSSLSSAQTHLSSSETIENIVNKQLEEVSLEERKRLHDEFFSHGPLAPLLDDDSITEILINNSKDIWIDRNGSLEKQEDVFLSEETFQRWSLLFHEESQSQVNLNFPFSNSKWKNFRVHVVSSPIVENGPVISLRRHPEHPWTLNRLKEKKWTTDAGFTFIKKMIAERKNFLVAGPTSSGKTSVLNAFFQEVPKNERCLFLEDTLELILPNSASLKLVTRLDPNKQLNDIHLCDLVKQSLRMRPDRLIIGEIRGPEAKDLLLAMATGHSGCAGTLHAKKPDETLRRLEMLIQLGAPQWDLASVRHLIQSTIDYILIVSKDEQGFRSLQEISRLCSVESFGITLEKVF